MPDSSAPADPSSGVSRRDLLLATKLYIPRRRSNLVPRPRLTERLNAGLKRKLTLISAPAGYGKTTLLSEWIPQSERCVAWVSLDEGDNDPARFWAYFVAALQTLRTDIGAQASSLLQSRQPVSAEPFVTILANEIDAFPDSFALVLDDYHVIETQSIHQALAFLLDHLPPRMHLIVASRTDPLLPLAHLRARDEMTELRAEDLSFASDEATTFLNHIMHLNLSTDHVAALAARTEGWIAGLQLTALSMRGGEDQSGFVAAFTGSHRFILDYLSDQVLEQQPAPLQSFLLQTSILDRLNAPLCDAVTGQSDGQSTLEMLEQHNLFLVPLDSERCWYRYHQLFADVLRHRLQQAQPGALAVLHRRASQWYETEGLLPEAVAHALATRDFEHAALLIERGVEKLWQRGEIATLTNWMQALPDAVRRARPGVCLAYARVLADMARYTAVEALVVEAEHELEHHPPADNSLVACLHGQAIALRAYLAVPRGEFDRAIELSRQAQQLIAEDDLAWRSFVALNLAGAYRFSSDWPAASQVYAEASALSQSAGNNIGALIALSMRGEVIQAQGQLHQAVQQYEQILNFAQSWGIPQAPLTGYALVGLGRVWCEWNDLDAADQYVRQGLERGRQANIMDMLLRSYLALARIRQSQGDLAGALDALRDVEPAVQHMGVAAIKDWVDALRVQLWLAQGDTAAAAQWAAHYAGGAIDAVYPAVPIALARVRLMQGDPDEAVRLLERALHSAQEIGRMGNAVQILAVKALAHRAQGNPDQALAALETALAVAEPEGYVRVFVDEGQPMARLLRRAAAHVPSSNYIRRLLEALGEPPTVAIADSAALAEPLSQRELEILRLIADGATNREIAAELVLTVNTVKKHVGNIFGKLGATNRTQAIARAREANLL